MARALHDDVLALPDGDVAMLRRDGADRAAGTLFFFHANGLNAGAYRPFLDAIDLPCAIVAPDARGHGRTTLPAEPDALTQWTLYADDIERIVRALPSPGPLFFAGHSMGAVSAMLCAKSVGPDRLAMIEPVLIPRLVRLVARSPLRSAFFAHVGIAARAARRRNGWPDRDAVASHYRSNPFFARWQEEALAGYLSRGIEDGPDGSVVLSCDPAWEAASFAAQGHRFWGPLGDAAAGLPVDILTASGRSTVPDADKMRLVQTGARLNGMDGTHMLPTERPRDVAAWVGMRLSGGGV